MHGRIYQLIEESKTGQFDCISADTFDYEDFFLREVADYVDAVEPEHYDYEQEVFFKNVTSFAHLIFSSFTIRVPLGSSCGTGSAKSTLKRTTKPSCIAWKT